MSSTYLRTIRVSGADARSFLQGQLSADIDALAPSRPLLASCNSAQGRVQAVVWLTDHGEWINLALPASLSERIVMRLRKYILRSKVAIEEQSGSVSFVPPHAYSASDWRLGGIRAGLPQVYPETHEAFIAQMLNLDLLGGVSFEKGCYTGQEIIARTHFRGAIKRRMFRFTSSSPPPAPGTRILAGDQHAGDVVDAAATKEGSELLAVIALTQQDAALELESSRGATLTKLPLPYAIGVSQASA